MLILAALLLQSADDLGTRIDALAGDLKEAKIGLVARSTQAGRALVSREAKEALILASNTKLLTTSCALAKLGPDFTFVTTAGLEGAELHVFGGGDPNLSGRTFKEDPTALFQDWARKLRAEGVGKLDAIVLHPALFDRQYLHPDWIKQKYDQDAWWCAPVGALSLNDNCVDILYEAGAAEGDPVAITIRPDTKYVKLVNESRTAKSPDPRKPFGLVRKDGTNEILARGELALGTKRRTTWIAIQDPTAYFGAVLKETLERAGLAVGAVKESDTLLDAHPKLKVVATYESDLASTIRVCNTVSQNFYAEMICKTLGVKFKGKGTAEAGAAVVVEWLTSVGVEATLADGCGLSRSNRCTAEGLVTLLTWWQKHRHFKVWRDSLAVSGTEPGTLRRRMTSIKGKVQAKTGHINGVACLSGYLDTDGGDTIVFSILVNEAQAAPADRFQDRVCEMLVKLKGD
jgi:D-alanyl-D-alanine carboxypeptidase/D-alanyl-D-alanine-endopeptidase (penicillin-binding protein 4)